MSLSLNLFTSTKGHFGRKDIYLITVKDLLSRANIFYNKTAHIKRSQNDDAVFDDMHRNLSELGFNVIWTFGEWSHNNPSHAYEYTKDIVKMFNDSNVNKCEYSCFWEDDWTLRVTNGFRNSISRLLYEGIGILYENPELLSVRFNSQPYEKDKVINKEGYLLQAENYTPWGPTFTFQPTIVRTRDMKIAYNLIARNWNHFKDIHIELASGIALKNLTTSPTPFAFFDYDLVRAIHIGAPPFEQVLC